MSKTIEQQPQQSKHQQVQQTNSTYCFKWSNYHHHLSGVVRQLLQEECMVDVTLYAEGERIYAHKIVLSTCSSLFQEILSQVNDEHPTIILSDISAQDVRSIVEFSYNGEVKIPVENINNLLEAAHSLKIHGLMEIEGLDESEMIHDLDTTNDTNSDKDTDNSVNKDTENDTGENPTKCRRRKSFIKKEYTDEMLAAAIEDLKTGNTLVDTALKYNIPRSTLYMRAKTLGVTMNASRNEYPPECMKGAIDAVVAGSSLQQAADAFGIPKTVLWRRIQKEGYKVFRHDNRRSYDTEVREAAIKALERGENLSKVAHEYQIPKTTLFRDKVRLINSGKLPLTFWKQRKSESEELKRARLEEAVMACKDGRMSQATASVVYQIPKTTIWRRLQMGSKKDETSTSSNKRDLEDKSDTQESKKSKTDDLDSHDVKAELTEADFEFCDDSLEIPISYIDESNLPENSVIILTSDEVEQLNLTNSTALAVQQDVLEDGLIEGDLDDVNEDAEATTSKS